VLRRPNKDKEVYILHGSKESSVVVKFESISGEQIEDRAARWATLYDVAGVTKGESGIKIPRTERLKSEEFEALQKLPLVRAEDVEDRLALLESIRSAETRPRFILKMETADVGDSLGDMIKPKEGKPPAKKIDVTEKVCHQLGVIAFFDLLVGNNDRFRWLPPKSIKKPEKTPAVNFENVEFTKSGEVLSLDYLDPTTRLETEVTDKTFPEHTFIEDRAARQAYATGALTQILIGLGAEKSDKTMEKLVDAFVAGMNYAAKQTKKALELFRGLAEKYKGKPRGNAATAIVRRIEAVTSED
jgi:hypothetical protein